MISKVANATHRRKTIGKLDDADADSSIYIASRIYSAFPASNHRPTTLNVLQSPGHDVSGPVAASRH
jgi:hypothetical protein